MRLGINTVLWFWPFDVNKSGIFEKIREIGFDTVEFALVDRSDDTVMKIQKSLEKYGLDCVIDGVVSSGRDICSPDRMTMNSGRDYLKECIELCDKLNSRYLVGPTYAVGIKEYLFEPSGRLDAWKRCVESYQLVADLAEKKGVMIAIEPLNRYESNFLNTVEQVRKLVDEINCPFVGIQLDTFHMNIEEKSFYNAILNAGKKLFHMHIPENDRGTPGTGLVKWNDVIKGLNKIDYQHNIDLEIAHPGVENIREPGAIWRVYDYYDQDEMAREGYNYLKLLLSKYKRL